MNKEIKYIQENFIESMDLCRKAGIDQEKLDLLIEKELIPNASYTFETMYKITSPLGDEKTKSETKKYFPKNIVALIVRNNTLTDSGEFKKQLKDEFVKTFLDSDDNRYGYDNILDQNGNVTMEKLDLAFEQEWQYYLQGIYGICTLNATGAEIAKKEIAVKKLIEFNALHNEKKLSTEEKEQLIKLNNQFNEVSNLFAPYQRESSSRGKYLDKILRVNSLSELVKDYG